MVIVVALRTSSQVATASERVATQEVFRQVSGRIAQVRIIDRRTDSKSSLGSGFFVAPDVVVTNFHVISELVHHPKRYRVELVRDGEAGEPAELLNLDVVHDLALLRASRPNDGVLSFAAALPPKGQRLYALGNPYDLGSSIVEGTFNGLLENSMYEKIHFTGAINPGMSGGPTIDAANEVVGVNVSTAGDEVGFLVPAKFASDLVARSTGPEFVVPSSFRDLVRDQLVAHQDHHLRVLLAQPFAAVKLGGFELPGKIAPYFRCWGDTTAPTGDSPYELARHECGSSDNIFVGRAVRSGSMNIKHELIRSETLNRFQFAALYESRFGQDRPFSFGEREVTGFRCHSDFVEQGGVSWKGVVCLRAYKVLDGLYDLSLSVASLNEDHRGVHTTAQLTGITYLNAMAFTKQYLEALAWRP